MNISKSKYLIIFLTLFTFGGVLNQLGKTLLLDILILLLCVFTIAKGNIKIRSRHFIVLFAVWLLALISALFTGTSLSFYTGFFYHTMLAVLIITAFNYNYQEINGYIFKCSWAFCYLGLLNFFLYTLTPSLFTDVGSSTSTVRTIFYVFNYIEGDGIFSVRNQGVFWEPGVFQIVLNMHIYNILIEREEKIKKAILPILLIITTFSTTGLLIMAIILTYWMIVIRKVKFNIGTIFLITVFALLLVPFIVGNVQTKLEGTHGSAAARTFDLYMGLEIMKQEPIFGIGMDPESYLKRTTAIDLGYYDVTRLSLERGNTNTYMGVAIMFGIPVALLFILALYNQKIFTRKLLFFTILLLGFFSEPLFGQLFVFLLCFSAVKGRKNIEMKSVPIGLIHHKDCGSEKYIVNMS